MLITLDRLLRNIWSQSVFKPFLLGLFRSESWFIIWSTVPEILANYMFLIQLSNYRLLPSAFPWPPISKWTNSLCSPGHSKQVTTQHFVNRWSRSWDMINTSFSIYIGLVFAMHSNGRKLNNLVHLKRPWTELTGPCWFLQRFCIFSW